MGADDDPRAVVDENGKVRRVDGLYAGDASIMPDTPSVATNPTVILMAEIVADRIKAARAKTNGHTSARSAGHERAVAVIPVERDQAVELAARTESRERRKCSSPKPNRRERSEQYGK